MRSAATALAMAVGGTSLICYLLMRRLQTAARDLVGSDSGAGGDGGGDGGGD
jgi:hypothetical protein